MESSCLISSGFSCQVAASALSRACWWLGVVIVFLVLLLLAIGVVGTVGYYGSLGNSSHLWAGIFVVGLVLLSAWSATQINTRHRWARSLHISSNLVLLIGLVWVSLTGWEVVQKYL